MWHPPDGHNKGQGKMYSFDEYVKYFTQRLASAPVVEVGEWQAIQDKSSPFSSTIEVEDVTVDVDIPESVEQWQSVVKPNLPWAEEHFNERISGVPYNPPPSHVRWPFAQQDNLEHTVAGQFSHTYPERFFPVFANGSTFPRWGIRYELGTLDDLIALLRRRPDTRQAYLPIWFPEDLRAAAENHRVPCSLGYHFLLRNGRLKIVYYMRSCDFYRYFRDDAYMAGRLCQFVAEEIGASPSHLVMHISSLHIFAPERAKIVGEAKLAG